MASISAVTGFGIFVTLDELFVEGLVHISELGSDYFQFDAAQARVARRAHRQVSGSADRVRVRVVRVDLDLAPRSISSRRRRMSAWRPLGTGLLYGFHPVLRGCARRPTRSRSSISMRTRNDARMRDLERQALEKPACG